MLSGGCLGRRSLDARRSNVERKLMLGNGLVGAPGLVDKIRGVDTIRGPKAAVEARATGPDQARSCLTHPPRQVLEAPEKRAIQEFG